MSALAKQKKRMNQVMLEGVNLLFRNFEGREGQFNNAGDRNFCALLDEETAAAMAADGWNVKYLRAREEGEVDQAYIKVKVNFGNRPPTCVMVTSRGRTTLSEDVVGLLDWAEFENVDLTITPYHYEIRGETGVSAYLKNIFATIRENELERKYANIPEIGSIQDQEQLQLESAQDIIVLEETRPGYYEIES